MGVKQFKISLPITLKILIILKNKLIKYGLKKGAFLEEIALLVGRSKTTTNEVLRFLEDKELIFRKYERVIKSGKKRKENFISPLGLDLLKTEIYDNFIQDKDFGENLIDFKQEKNFALM